MVFEVAFQGVHPDERKKSSPAHHPYSRMRVGQGGPRFRDNRNPRSKEDRAWKHIEKIPINESAFPPNVKPAAIIIGVKGSNHARMQDEAGCCVQLRGKGISSPGTPGADEPIHLWVKYDTEAQLQKVKDVLQEIIRSCEKGPPPEVRKKGGPNSGLVGGRGGRAPVVFQAPNTMSPAVSHPPFQEFSDVLPMKPTTMPTSPLECCFTIHYFAHARKGITTDIFESAYQDYFGFALDKRLAQLGGSLVGSLAMLPQIVRLEEVGTGKPCPQPADPAFNPMAVYVVRSVLPAGMPWMAFYNHVAYHQSASSNQPPPPPPPQQQAAANNMNIRDSPRRNAMSGDIASVHSAAVGSAGGQTPLGGMVPSQAPGHTEVPTPAETTPASRPAYRITGPPGICNFNGPLPSPMCLAIQGIYALLVNKATELVGWENTELLKKWAGVPLSDVHALFANEYGIDLQAPNCFGFPDIATFILHAAKPEILDIYWSSTAGPRGGYLLRLGDQLLSPDFTLVDKKLEAH
eukprot:Blabericola_migrator_1__8081@NODE_415_length_8708_cov_199_498322_g327_i0_p2_GENE_NODE_415_length_8708_cov_199_498322_g327_i0NODE_415_length_8708_cov_199_498322_g327_i0_p2_ORF_typecomplete_len518_score94_06KH_1/PF00013_29/0_028CAP_N/PF01213_19/0_6DUF2076/PF09849_9/8_7e02DUF2076/PF09849_9/0_54_NODE_415_length_8708_cov_199_498322_g327_i010842637